MFSFLRGGGRPHRGVHRRRGASPRSVLPSLTVLLDVRLLIPQADPWERFA